jgi:Flp pilus assembly protein TadG
MRAGTMTSLSKHAARLRHSFVRWPQDDRGFGAVEFAMIFPLMLVMFFGMIDVSAFVGTKRKVTVIAQSMADLAARSGRATDLEIDNFIAIGNAMIAPQAAADLSVTISQIYLDPSAKGLGRVYWSKGKAALGSTATVTVPEGLIKKDADGKVLPDQYLIYAQVTYLFRPIAGSGVFGGTFLLEEETYTRPRKSVCVYYSAADNCK